MCSDRSAWLRAAHATIKARELGAPRTKLSCSSVLKPFGMRRETDTDFSNVWADVNGAPAFDSPSNAFYGDLGNGMYQVPGDASYVDFVLTNPDDIATFGFNVINHGGTNLAGFEATLNQIATAAAQLALESEAGEDDPNLGADSNAFPALAQGIEALLDDLINFIFPDCDGPVAGLAFHYTKAALDALLPTGGQLSVSNKLIPGIDSQGGCGSNSRYRVWYAIVRS